MIRGAIIASLAAALLAACAAEQISPENRAAFCPVAVEAATDALALRPNPLAHPATGPLAGAAGGAGATLFLGAGAVFVAPVAAVLGAAYGAACADAASSHPAAESDFAAAVRAAYDRGTLPQSVAAQLNGPPPSACIVADEARTTVRIERVDVEMGCAFGKQQYALAVRWRAIDASDPQTRVEKTTRCRIVSSRDVDEWLADGAVATREIDAVLGRVGQRIAAELAAPRGLPECLLRTTKEGYTEAK